jgi:bifunctional DNA-binding transcriptional regulator/antitoxin component of YhaV-PrlF toxin-antitoxin module
MDTAYMTSNGRVAVPIRLRRKYGITPAVKICFIESDGEILFRPITPHYIRSVCGMLKSKGSATGELLKERAEEEKREEAKLRKLAGR